MTLFPLPKEIFLSDLSEGDRKRLIFLIKQAHCANAALGALDQNNFTEVKHSLSMLVGLFKEECVDIATSFPNKSEASSSEFDRMIAQVFLPRKPKEARTSMLD